MKYLSLLVSFLCLSLQFGFSQVKKQYLDNKNTASTIVIKEDKASDKDILNSQFDINSIGFEQEIRIKTENNGLKPILVKIPLAEVPLEGTPIVMVPKGVLAPRTENNRLKPILEKIPLAEVPLDETPFVLVAKGVLAPRTGKNHLKPTLEKIPLAEVSLEDVPLLVVVPKKVLTPRTGENHLKPTLEKIPLAEVPLEETPIVEVPLEEVPLVEVPKDVLTPKGGNCLLYTSPSPRDRG